MNRNLTGLRRDRRAYRETFESDAGRHVLADLHRFCMCATPTAEPNEAVFVMGMQRVFRRIAAMSGTDPAALQALFETSQEESDDD